MSRGIVQKEHDYISDNNVDKNSELFKDSFINWEEIFLRLPSIETYVEKNVESRLTGGADNEVNEILDHEEPLIIETPDEQIDGNEKLEKTIERVFENLKDATGALENIEKNHEQELKLMLEEITTKIKTWKGDVQLKIDAAGTELSKIKIQLLNQVSEVKAKDRELLNLKNKIKQAEESKIAYEKSTNTANNSKALGIQTITSSQVFQKAPQQSQQQVQSFAEFKRMNPSLIFSLQSSDHQNKQTLGVPTTLGVNQSQLRMIKDQEQNKKQAELEAECQRLKNENERILKEHAEYENEIQQALLRGVSCLNVEALKILGKSPFSCCVSCSPCNITKNNTTNIEAAKVMKDNWTPQGNKLKTNDLYQLKEKPKIKKKAATICCGSSGNCNKSSKQNSMIFLLPQKRQSTLNNNNPIDYPRFCARSNVVKNKNYCSGKLLSNYHNNCNNICSIVRENSRAIADIFGASSHQKYCEPYI
ncbi:uncharacterized protein LOC122853549 [Aphidius gifuensis]|uniref:uncharacterized protein LOC122853549 n=1 Tax=Aphidius gifuensis TaxID=684658 RepID=UPI001CDCF5CF|nr:uncharacterized protein LOC122853549 [Aphidius gifuensis]